MEFLRAYLHTDIVILLAESMGHLDRPPGAAPAHLFSAYVATDLYVDMVGNETVKYRLTLDRLRAAATATP